MPGSTSRSSAVQSSMSGDVMSGDGNWLAAPSGTRWRLSEDKVHLWRANLVLPASRIRALESVISSDERARAARFVVDRARNRYIIARAVLRNILARYVSCGPEDLRFSYAEHGKPALEYPATSIEFNVSHSHDLALYALTSDHPVGVDLEYLFRRSTVDRLKIAHRFFSDREYNTLASLPRNRRDHAFLACWTRKEAFVKAIGQGLSCPLDQFDVTVDPDDTAELLATRWDPSDVARWTMASIDPGPDYVGALAVKGIGVRFDRWQWDHEQFE